MRSPVRIGIVTVALVSLSAYVGGAPPAAAQDAPALKAKAKEVLAANRDAVIHVRAAIKISFGGMDQDQQVELLGTVIDPSGLTVLSESGLNPGAMFESMMGGMGGGEIKSSVGDVKMVMKDGKEIPASVVLRDKDLDLAFVRPIEKGLTVTAVSLDGAKASDVLDDVIVVGRLGRSLDRMPTVTLGRVAAVVKKPRTYYACETGAAAVSSTGCPVFDASGKLIGIFLQRRAARSGSGGFDIQGMVGAMMPVVLPAEDVKEVAQQAPAEAPKAPKEEKKAEEPKKDGVVAPPPEERK